MAYRKGCRLASHIGPHPAKWVHHKVLDLGDEQHGGHVPGTLQDLRLPFFRSCGEQYEISAIAVLFPFLLDLRVSLSRQVNFPEIGFVRIHDGIAIKREFSSPFEFRLVVAEYHRPGQFVLDVLTRNIPAGIYIPGAAVFMPRDGPDDHGQFSFHQVRHVLLRPVIAGEKIHQVLNRAGMNPQAIQDYPTSHPPLSLSAALSETEEVW